MKQTLVTIALLFSTYLSVSAQKEVYFNTTKPEDIKVASMQGIDIESGLNPISIINNLKYQSKSWNIPLSIGYFNEKRIASTWTLLYKVKLMNSFSNTPVISYDSINHSYGFDNNSPYKAEYSLGIGISFEPRWYFSYKKRYQLGMAKLNSGWFLSLPLSLNSTLINTFKFPQDVYWSSFKNIGSISLAPIIGYRNSVTKQLFLEGNIKIVNSNLNVNSFRKQLSINLNIPALNFFPELSIKASYVFK